MKTGRMLVALAAVLLCVQVRASEPVRIGRFDIDASPPIGSPLAYDPTVGVTTPLSCRGIVLLGDGAPIVLCAVDWIGISNDGHRLFCEHLARAAGTTVDRVSVHTLHQHDAPWCDFSVDAIGAEYGLGGVRFDPAFARDVIERAGAAVEKAVASAVPVTHVGYGQAEVKQVASNRRILGPDGKVQHIRFTATKNPKIRAFPEGVIDPQLKLIGFWDGDDPVVMLTYYATHPQSYYRTGLATPDFPGLARNARQEETGIFHVHFCGAGGNIGAGKYNDGAPENRERLKARVEAGMKGALDNVRKVPITSEDVGWETVNVRLPPSQHLNEEQLLAELKNENLEPLARVRAASHLVFLRASNAGREHSIGCLSAGPVRILHMPGELFVEYQLAAQALRPDLFVAMAAYGEYSPGYIGTAIAYEQGGYETRPTSSPVAPEVEQVLVGAMRKLLDAEDADLPPLGVEAAAREVEAARKAEAQ